MKEEEKKVLSGQATDEQIAMWKNLHGKVFQFEVDGSVCYLKRPSRNVISAAETIGKEDNLKYAEIVLNNCWLGGDETIKTDDEKFISVANHMGTLVKISEVAVKEL